MSSALYILVSLVAVFAAGSCGDVEICPGEGPRYGDFKCNHDITHRVCARLVDNSEGQCEELSWDKEKESFWKITNQEQYNWKDRICGGPNPGDSWCICMWATASLISRVGCENVHIHCKSTDVQYILDKYIDRGVDGTVDLTPAKECLEKKCVHTQDETLRYYKANGYTRSSSYNLFLGLLLCFILWM